MDKRPAEEKQQFKLGEDVHVEFIGTVKSVESGPDGLRYVVESYGANGLGYVRAFVKQCQISRLPEPADFGIKEEACNGN